MLSFSIYDALSDNLSIRAEEGLKIKLAPQSNSKDTRHLPRISDKTWLSSEEFKICDVVDDEDEDEDKEDEDEEEVSGVDVEMRFNFALIMDLVKVAIVS